MSDIFTNGFAKLINYTIFDIDLIEEFLDVIYLDKTPLINVDMIFNVSKLGEPRLFCPKSDQTNDSSENDSGDSILGKDYTTLIIVIVTIDAIQIPY